MRRFVVFASLFTVACAPITQMVIPIQTIRHGDSDFSYSIAKTAPNYSLQAVDGTKTVDMVDSILWDGQISKLVRNRLILRLKENSDAFAAQVAKRIGGVVLDHHYIKDAPIMSGSKKSGNLKLTDRGTGHFIPTYVLKVNKTGAFDKVEFERLAKKFDLKGHHEFPAAESLHFMYSALKLKEEMNEVGGDVFTDAVIEPGQYTWEGGDKATGTFPEEAPNGSKFWFVGPNNATAYYGCNISSNSVSGDATWKYPGPNPYTRPRVAVIDSGFLNYSTEPSMPYSIIARDETTWNVMTNSTNISGIGYDSSKPWHGRQVTSLIFAPYGDSQGTIGSCDDCDPILVKSDYYTSNLALAVDKAVQLGAKVINFSIGGVISTWSTDPLRTAIVNARNAGVIVVAISGNSGIQSGYYPGGDTNVLCVSAHSKNGTRPSWANTNGVDIYAPGDAIPVATDYSGISYDLNFYRLASGTSMASPIVAGIIAKAAWRGKCSDLTSAISLVQSKAYTTYPAGKSLNAIATVQ